MKKIFTSGGLKYLHLFYCFYIMIMYTSWLNESLIFYGICLYFAILMVYSLVNKELVKDKLTILLSILLVTYAMSNILNITYTSIYSYIRIAESFILFYGICFLQKNEESKKIDKEKKNIFDIFLFVNLIAMLISCYFYAINNDLYFANGYTIIMRKERFAGIFSNPGTTATFTFISMFLACYMLKIKKGYIKIYYTFILCLSLLLFVASGNRALLIALVLILLFFFIGLFVKLKLVNKLLLIFLALILLSGSIFIGNQMNEKLKLGRDYSDNFEELKDTLAAENSSEKMIKIENALNVISSERYYLWKECVQWGFKKPLFGYGLDSLRIVAKKYKSIQPDSFNNAHNVFINHFFHTGILGLIIIVAITVQLIKDTWKYLNRNKKLYPECIFLCCIVFGLYFYNLLDIAVFLDIRMPSFFFWLIMGYIEYDNYQFSKASEELVL